MTPFVVEKLTVKFYYIYTTVSLKNLRGHVTVTTPKFFKILVRGHVGTVPGNTPAEFEAVLELLAFDAQKFTGSRDRDHAHILDIFVRGQVGTVHGNTSAKFEVRTFSRFGAISI